MAPSTADLLSAYALPPIPLIPLPPLPRIRDQVYYDLVTTHSSLRKVSRSNHELDPREGLTDYEKLEHVGDAILGAIVAVILHDVFPMIGEGPASMLKGQLVSNAVLAQISDRYAIPSLLRTDIGGQHIVKGQVKVRASMFEAWVAGVYYTVLNGPEEEGGSERGDGGGIGAESRRDEGEGVGECEEGISEGGDVQTKNCEDGKWQRPCESCELKGPIAEDTMCRTAGERYDDQERHGHVLGSEQQPDPEEGRSDREGQVTIVVVENESSSPETSESNPATWEANHSDARQSVQPLAPPCSDNDIPIPSSPSDSRPFDADSLKGIVKKAVRFAETVETASTAHRATERCASYIMDDPLPAPITAQGQVPPPIEQSETDTTRDIPCDRCCLCPVQDSALTDVDADSSPSSSPPSPNSQTSAAAPSGQASLISTAIPPQKSNSLSPESLPPSPTFESTPRNDAQTKFHRYRWLAMCQLDNWLRPIFTPLAHWAMDQFRAERERIKAERMAILVRHRAEAEGYGFDPELERKSKGCNAAMHQWVMKGKGRVREPIYEVQNVIMGDASSASVLGGVGPGWRVKGTVEDEAGNIYTATETKPAKKVALSIVTYRLGIQLGIIQDDKERKRMEQALGIERDAATKGSIEA